MLAEKSIMEDALIYFTALSLSALIIPMLTFESLEESIKTGISFSFFMLFAGFAFTPAYLIEDSKKRKLVISFTLASLLYLLAVGRTDHMIMTVFPLTSLGIASLMNGIYERSLAEMPESLKRLKLRISAKALRVLCFYSIPALACISAFMILLGNLSINPLESIKATVQYVNENTQEGDLVLAYSWMFPMITKAKVGLLTQSLAIEGIPIEYYPGDFPKERFEINTSYKKAKFIVSDGNMPEWVENKTGRADVAEELAGWHKTKLANFTVYRNPDA
jgi:hypothetical protein